MHTRLSSSFHNLSLISFGATIILFPFRYRITLVERPVGLLYRDYTDFILLASDIALIATLAFWGISLIRSQKSINFGPKFLTWPLIGLTVISIVSTLFSIDPALSLYHSARMVLLFGMYLFILNEIKTLNILIIPLVAQVLTQAVVGIYQALEQRSIGLQKLGEYELDPSQSGISIVWAEGVRSLRAYGLSDHPNILGGSFVFALLLIAVWLISNEKSWQLPVLGVQTLGILGLIYTYSRSAWLAYILGSLLIGYLIWRNHPHQLITKYVMLMITLLIVILPFLWANNKILGVRFGFGNSIEQIPTEVASIRERQILNREATKVFSNNGAFGVGLGTMPLAIRAQNPNFEFYYQPAHVVLLNVAGETGLIGALFYSALLIAPWVMLFGNKKLNLSIELIGVSGALLATTIIGFFDYYTWLFSTGRLWQWAIWGLWGAMYQAAAKREPHG